MTDKVGTLNSFLRQLAAPKGSGKVETAKFGADHRNDLTGKLAYIKDVWNAVRDGFQWLFSVELKKGQNGKEETWGDSWHNFRSSAVSKGGLDKRNLADKALDNTRMNDTVMQPLFNNQNKREFEVECEGGNTDNKLKFKQAGPNDLIKYTTIEKWELDGTGDSYHLIESTTLWGKNFLDVYQDLQACLHDNNDDDDNARYIYN